MFDIITFGSATFDVFLRPKKFEIVKDKKFITGKGICFNLGSKVDIEDIYFSSGGGGTNTAVTFAKQGFKVAYCGTVGDDIFGKEVIEELEKFGVDCQFISKTKLKATNFSVILNSSLKTDRTILVYRGASEILDEKDIPWQRLKAKWFYLAPFSGKLCKLTPDIVNFARKNKIKVAFNPGNSQFFLPKKTIEGIIKKVDILILNQEEASMLTKIPYQKEKAIFSKIDEICHGIAIMTRGPKGVVVSDGKYLYRAGTPKSKVIDRTGAGDSFASGFVSEFIFSEGDIEKSIQLGIANATACLSKIGAQNGLLKKGDNVPEIKVEKELCSNNGLCKAK